MSVRHTVILNSIELRYLLIDCLKKYSSNSNFISGKNPYRFSVNKQSFYILIKNVHESGEGRSNQDECRIQISKSREFNTALFSENPVIVLGYFHDYKVFTAWDPYLMKDRFNLKQSISVYSRFNIQKKASKFGISNYVDGNQQSIISFLPEYLGLYLENHRYIHRLQDIELLELIKKSDESNDDDSFEEVDLDKHKFTITHKRYKRDKNFRETIYEAYGHKCAMCDVGLGIVEAAHIIPISDEDGTDEIDNGICLCPLHHKAYDNGIIYFNEEYDIKLNDHKIEYLIKMGLDSGIQQLKNISHNKLTLPLNPFFEPDCEKINLANLKRGIDAS